LPRFDTVIVVDWSAASTPAPPRESADAIWMAVHGGDSTASHYVRTRAALASRLHDILDAEAAAGRRVLLGFDFPFGYPEGFARRLTGQDGAAAVWDWLSAHLSDSPDNRNDRFELAARINASFGGRGPFWGRPRSLALAALSERKDVDYPALGLAERRRVEQAVPRAQPVWKLFTTGSVGSQALTGLPLVARLARRPGTSVWPFGAGGHLVLAEVYPSLLDAAVAADTGHPVKDERQVRLLARALWRLSQAGRLGPLLHDIPDWPGRADEGWILGAGHAPALMEALG
jgi:molybdopterin-guanine dinucleotide biosynthesis protein B